MNHIIIITLKSKTKNITCSIRWKLLRLIDSERGEVSRSKYMNGLLEAALREKSVSIGKDWSHSQ